MPTPIVVAQITTGDQSAPKSVLLNDGRVLYVWSNNALADGSLAMTVEGRIFNADGTASTDQFRIGTKAIDGTDGYDIDNLDVTVLTGGNVVVGWVRADIEPSDDEPIFSIIDTTKSPTDPLFKVATDVEAQQNDTTVYESPPVLTALDDGRFMAVWSKDGLGDSVSSTVQARIFNADGTPSTNEFQVGTWSVDGSDGYDVPAIEVTQLADGNVVIGYVRAYGNPGGDEPVFSIVDPTFVPGDPAFNVATNVEMQQTDTTVWESPPQITALSDGRFMAVWAKNGLGDNNVANKLQGRIFNADGTPSTDEFQIGARSVEGDDIWEIPNFDVTELQDGRIVVGYTSGYAETGSDHPQFSIIDPTQSPGAGGFFIVSDVRINNQLPPASGWQGPPTILAMPNSNGKFIAVWLDGFDLDGALKYRVYDSNGTPLSDETILSTGVNNYVDSSNGFDWSTIQLLAIDNNNFVIGWAGANDGSGTGAFSVGVTAVCFTEDTPIRTPVGNRPIRDLKVGDLVWTEGGVYQPIRWIKGRYLSERDLQQNPNFRPIRIAAGALGKGMPVDDLVLSPQHRVLVRSKIARNRLGKLEVLFAARDLLCLPGVTVAEDMADVTYWHFMLEKHSLVDAAGTLAESLFLGAQAQKSLAGAALEEIFSIFPELGQCGNGFAPVRALVDHATAREIAELHALRQRAMIEVAG